MYYNMGAESINTGHPKFHKLLSAEYTEQTHHS